MSSQVRTGIKALLIAGFMCSGTAPAPASAQSGEAVAIEFSGAQDPAFSDDVEHLVDGRIGHGFARNPR